MNRPILSVCLSFMVVVTLYSCQQKQTPPPQPVPVNVFTVKATPVVYFDRYTGTTTALSQVNLLAQVQGYITGIFFKEGSHVKKGQVLYEIDKRLYTAALDQAVANLKVAHGNTVQAQQDADRYTYLNKENAVAKQLYDHAVITLENAINAEKAAQQGVETAKTNLGYSVIRAPFDGTIGISQVKIGDYMNVGATILNTISTDDPMAVDFLINEKQLIHFEDIYSGKYKHIDSLFTFLMPDNSLYPHPGKISVIDRAVDPQTGDIRVRLVFPNPDYYLRAGMSCVVKVHNTDSIPRLLIPNKAIVEQMGEFFVFVAKDTTIVKSDTGAKDQKEEKYEGLIALQKKVMPGQTIGPNIIIEQGINDGDKVVIDGVQSLHDGSHITTANHPPTGAAGAGKGGATGKPGAQ